MSTGDLKNNLQKLQSELKAVRYDRDIDYENLSKGMPQAFLPLYHYVFMNYSTAIAEQIADLHIVLENKSDARFVDGIYKVLREMFSYKPLISKEQFFTAGFVERKVIMATEVTSLLRRRKRSLVPKAGVRTPRNVSSCRTVSRSDSPIARDSRRMQRRCVTPDDSATTTADEPSPLSSSEHHARCVPPLLPLPRTSALPDHVQQTHYAAHGYSSRHESDVGAVNGQQAAALSHQHVSHRAAFQSQLVAGDDIAVYDHAPSSVSHAFTLSAAANSLSSDAESRLQPTPPDHSLVNGEDQHSGLTQPHLSYKETSMLLQNVKDLNLRVASLEKTVALLAAQWDSQGAPTTTPTPVMTPAPTPTAATIENVTARLTLLENRVADHDAKVTKIGVGSDDVVDVRSTMTMTSPVEPYSSCVRPLSPKEPYSSCVRPLSPKLHTITVDLDRPKDDLAEGDRTQKCTDYQQEGIVAGSQALRIRDLMKQTDMLLETKSVLPAGAPCMLPTYAD